MNPQSETDIQPLNAAAKQAGEQLIALSTQEAARMQTWSDVPGQPNGLATGEFAGFINKPEADNGLQLVVDVQAPANREALLRIWGISSEINPNGVELYNNVQLNFTIDRTKAQAVTAKGSQVSRDDIRNLLNDSTTQLQSLTLSDRSGHNQETGETLGQRYEFTAGQPADQQPSMTTLSDTLRTVVTALAA